MRRLVMWVVLDLIALWLVFGCSAAVRQEPSATVACPVLDAVSGVPVDAVALAANVGALVVCPR